MIGVVAYGKGNLRSVTNALERIGTAYKTVDSVSGLDDCDRILLPGVGAFGDCMNRLSAKGFSSAVVEQVRKHGKPLLGICVGMQMLATEGEEFGLHAGLDLIPGRVVQIPRSDPDLRLPQVGWNTLQTNGDNPLFAGLKQDKSCYFVHSYHFLPTNPAHVSATVDYGGPVVAAVALPPVYGLQFHPEKSQGVGLTVLENFSKLRT